MYSMILALDENNLIGKGDQLPWHLPLDLEHFKMKTLNKPIAMGKKTFDSIGRPLPKRTNIVITRDKSFSHDGVLVFNSIESFDEWSKEQEDEEIIIIGGSNLLKQMYDKIKKLYLTHIFAAYEGDCFVDFINYDELVLTEMIKHSKEEGHEADFSFCTYEKK